MDIFSNQYNYGQNFYQNNNGQNLYIERNNLYQYNNNTLNNNFLNFLDMNQKKPPNNVQRKSNKNRNLYEPDERLNLFLQNLGLSNYIVNFQRSGITFEDFLALNRKDFNLIKIPNNVQEILELFIIDYVKVGSLYTKEEIEQFFQRRNQKRPQQNNANIMRNMGNNLRTRQPMNNWGMTNNQMKMRQKNSKNNLYNQQGNNRAKSQNNKQINYKQLLDNNNVNLQYGNNYGIINNQNMNNNNNNIGYQYYSNNIKKSNNMIRQNKANKTENINRKKNLINNSSNINNNYTSSTSNMNIYSPSVDNFSHLAIEENNSNLDNLKKMAKFRDMNNCNYNNLKRNLSGDVNFNDTNQIKSSHNINNKSSGKSNIIEQMDKVLERIQTRKENIYASTQASNHYHNFRENSIINANINKGYHSDGYLNEQKKIEQYNNLIKNNNKNNNSGYKTLKNNNYSYNNNNLKLNGYEINSYYTGDTSQFDSLRGESINIATPVVKKIRGKTGKILYYSKVHKIKEEQTKKIEHILGYGALSVTPKTPLNYTDKVFNTRGNSFNSKKGISMYNFDIYNNEDEMDLMTKNNSKSNLTNYTYGHNNNYVKPFNMNVNKNQNYQLFSRKNNNNVVTQKNTLVQSKIPQKQPNKNRYNNAQIFNNFNNYNYSNNKGNLSTNLNNNNNQGIKINSNIIGINNNNNKNKPKNQNNRPHSHYGPVQIQIKNGRKLDDNKNNNNMNQNFNKRTNNFMNNVNNNFSNQSSTNFSVGRTGNNYNDIMTNNYFNSIINVNNARAMKRNAKSLEKYGEQLNIGIYPGIHNINNNINNININNINYDGKALSNGFNNFMGMNKEMNYQTANNFYQPNDLNEGIYFDEII